MNPQVNLKEIAESLEMIPSEGSAFYDREADEVIIFDDDKLRDLQELDSPDDVPDWQREMLELAKLIDEQSSNRFIRLPDKDEIDEWEIMEEFASQQNNPRTSDTLLQSLQGRGAYRRFKDRIYDLDLEKKWFEFKTEQYRLFVIDWCKENKIEWREDEIGDESKPPSD